LGLSHDSGTGGETGPEGVGPKCKKRFFTNKLSIAGRCALRGVGTVWARIPSSLKRKKPSTYDGVGVGGGGIVSEGAKRG